MTRTWKLRLASVFIALALAVVIAEVGLRVIGFSSPNLITPDRYRGFALRPNAEGWFRREGEAYVQINSDGQRDRERAKEKPANTFRVAVLGDSMIEALQVPLEQTASAVMETSLQPCLALGGRKVEVLNFGTSSYGTAQELLTLRHKVWNYSPDLVLLAFTPTNDVKDNSRQLAHDSDLRAYFVYQNGQLVLDDSFLQAPRFQRQQSLAGRTVTWFKDHSRIAQIINDLRSARRAKQDAQDPKTIQAYDLIYREPTDPVWIEAWRVTEGTIQMMRDEVFQQNAKFVVAVLTTDRQVYPDPSVRREYAGRNGVNDLFYPNRRLKALGDRLGVEVIDLGEPLQQYADSNKVFLHGFGAQMGYGHWNADGNRVVGERLAGQICKGLENKKGL
jgi:hypothetical protein